MPFSIAFSRFTSSSSFASFSLSRVSWSAAPFRRLFTRGRLAVGGVELAHDSAPRSPRSASGAAPSCPCVKLLSRLFTALNLLPSMATLAFASSPILRHKLDELRADLLDGGAIVLAEIGDGFVIRSEPSRQPHHFQIAASLTLQPPARLDPVEIAVDVELEHRRRMIRRAGRSLPDRRHQTRGRGVPAHRRTHRPREQDCSRRPNHQGIPATASSAGDPPLERNPSSPPPPI